MLCLVFIDLDELVKNNGLDAILDSEKSFCPPPARHFSSGFQRFSVNTRRTADGVTVSPLPSYFTV